MGPTAEKGKKAPSQEDPAKGGGKDAIGLEI